MKHRRHSEVTTGGVKLCIPTYQISSSGREHGNREEKKVVRRV
jgi:hypothetical protein